MEWPNYQMEVDTLQDVLNIFYGWPVWRDKPPFAVLIIFYGWPIWVDKTPFKAFFKPGGDEAKK